MGPTHAQVAQAIDCAMGRRPGSLLLRNGRLLNLFSGESYLTDILLSGPLIAAIGPGYQAEAELDLEGRHIAPGLIDGHLHLESALVEPREYARAVLPRGVTGAVCDPHELANVVGTAGIEYVLGAAERLPFDIYVTASSCVPATTLETAGAALTVADIDQILSHPRVVGVAELMNFPGILAADPVEIEKALLADRHGKVADGHSPLLRGRGLNAYVAAGISSDHEATAIEEGREKLRLGMTLMIREASAARNLDALLPLITAATAHQICFVTDDRDPRDLMEEGGVDHLVRRAIAAGIEPITAIRLASLNTARHFHLARRGAVAPGYLADLVVLGDLERFRADLVFKSGQLVARDGQLLIDLPSHEDPRVLDTVHLPPLPPDPFAIPYRGGDVRAIELVPGEILTREAIVNPTSAGGLIHADADRDLAKLAVIERHGRNGGYQVGLVKGFGLRRGAIGSSVGHDSHNLLIAGIDDADMALAARCLAEMRGGFCAVADGQVLARLPLPIAGLMSQEPLEVVRAELDRLEAAGRALGITIHSPWMALSFLALPVIPALRLTDKGLVTVDGDGVRFVDLHTAAPTGGAR